MLARLAAYVRGVARRRAIESEIDEELQFHLLQETERHIMSGMSAPDARQRALRELGGLLQTREAVSDVRAIWLDDVRRDVRYAIRALRRSPQFTAVALLTLTVGIGANTAVFSIVNAVLLRPLPYRDPGSLVLLEPSPLTLSPGWAVTAWRTRSHSLVDVAGFNGPRAATVAVRGIPGHIDVADVTENFFAFLGTEFALGRSFSAQDRVPGAVISHALWTRQFGADRSALGSVIDIDGIDLTIVGVTPSTFRFPATGAMPASGLPIDTQPDVIRLARAGLPVNAIGRLSPRVTPDAASAELSSIFQQDGQGRFSQRLLDRARVGVAPLHDRLIGDVRQRLWLISGGVAFILLVVCANVANLQLARSATRRREFAIRSTLGAGRGRFVRQLLTESLVLSLSGAMGALLLTYWLRGIAHRIVTGTVPHVHEIPIDWWVLAFSVVFAILTGVGCGLASIPPSARRGQGIALNEASPRITGRSRLQPLLLAAEIAFTCVLVVGATLFGRTLWELSRTERGFDAAQVLTLRVAPGLPATVDRADGRAGRSYFAAFFAEMTERVPRVPGVLSVAATSNVPLGGVSAGLAQFSLDGQTISPGEEDSPATFVAAVTPGYFATLRTLILSGRDFTGTDGAGSPMVAIVNDTFRRRYAPGRDIVGAQVQYDKRRLTVVGVAADVPDRSLRRTTAPIIFTPLAQMASGSFGWGQLTIVARTHGRDPLTVAPLIRRAIWEIDPHVVLDEVTSMDERVAASIRTEREGASIFTVFAVVALVVAAIGVYGVAAYGITSRARELGIRLALGASPARLGQHVILATLRTAAAGIAVGLVGSIAATSLIASRLFGVSALDPVTYLTSAFVLAVVAILASYVPARRAMAVDPIVVLRTE